MILAVGSVFNSAIELITVIIIFVFVLLVTYYVTKWIDVSDMPHYPEEGSIEIRQDIIIVKF